MTHEEIKRENKWKHIIHGIKNDGRLDEEIVTTSSTGDFMNHEEKAREIVRLAIKDHDDGGWQEASLNETMAIRIADALAEAEKKGREEGMDGLPRLAIAQEMAEILVDIDNADILGSAVDEKVKSILKKWKELKK